MKQYLLSLIILFMLASCTTKESGWEVTVQGRVDLPGNGGVTIQAWSDTTQTELPAEWDAAAKTYKIKVRLSEPGFYRLNFFQSQTADVILNRSDLTVNLDAQGAVDVQGSPDLKVYEEVDRLQNAFQQSDLMIALNQAYGEAAERNDEAAMEEVRQTYLVEAGKVGDSIKLVLRSAMPSIAVIDVLNRNTLDADTHLKFFEEIAGAFPKDWVEYSLVKEFRDRVDKLKTTSIGATAPEIKLPDPDGKMVALSDFRGKYVLVDFWAKWCGPCRQENPNLVKAWNKFRTNNFQVIGVSLDRNRADWVQGIQEDGLDWIHISDLQYFNSEAAKSYNISAIPFSVLIDPKGVIVAKNLRGAELHATLEKYLTK